MKVKDFVRVVKLKNTKDLVALEAGEGCLYIDESGVNSLCHNGDAMHFLAYVEFCTGKLRGNHYHRERVENLCVLKGTLDAKFYLHTNPSEVLEIKLVQGDVVTVQAGCIHSYHASEPASVMEFAQQKFNPQDIYKLHD